MNRTRDAPPHTILGLGRNALLFQQQKYHRDNKTHLTNRNRKNTS